MSTVLHNECHELALEKYNSQVIIKGVSRPIRICFLIDNLAIGGTETQLLALIQHLDRSLFMPFLILLDGNGIQSQSMESSSCEVLRLGIHKLFTFRTLRSLLSFSRFLKNNEIDILQLYFRDSTYFGCIAGRIAKVKTIIRTRNNANHWMGLKDRLLGRMMNPCVDVTVCNSVAAQKAIRVDERPKVFSVFVIENGVDLDRFTQCYYPRHHQSKDYPLRVGMVANLRYIKGIDIFLQAASLIIRNNHAVTFHVAGDGPDRETLERDILKLGIQKRFFLEGRINNIPEFLSSLDVAVLSSRSEGMPNAILEYMAAAKPIVSTAFSGIESILQHDVHALVTPLCNYIKLAEAIEELLLNKDLASRLSLQARHHVVTRFSRKTMIDKFERLYLKLSNRVK